LHFERPSAHCATTLGGIDETSPPAISASGHGRYRACGTCELPNILSSTLVAAADPIGAFANWVIAGNSRLVTA
jgi:hypothetical protein